MCIRLGGGSSFQIQCPSGDHSDWGPQFSGTVWAALCKQMGVHHIQMTADHPPSNGLIERFHRQLRVALKARNCSPDWTSHFPWRRWVFGQLPTTYNSGLSKLVLPGEIPLPLDSTATSDIPSIRPPRPPKTRLGTCRRPSRAPTTLRQVSMCT